MIGPKPPEFLSCDRFLINPLSKVSLTSNYIVIGISPVRVQIAPFLEIKSLVNSLTFIYNSNIKSRKNNETQINPNKSWEAETNEVRN